MGPACLVWLSVAFFLLGLTAGAKVDPNLPALCYTDKNQLAPNWLMPCFSKLQDTGEVYGCCLAGDYCLENQACYDPERHITYQKGCTESLYEDDNCPMKCFTDQSKSDWTGLIYCNGTNGMPDNTWVCHHPDNCKRGCSQKWDPQLQVVANTYCEDVKHDGKWVAFQDGSPLRSIQSLPQPSDMASFYSHYSNYSTRWNRPPSTPPPSDPSAPITTELSSQETTLLAVPTTSEQLHPSPSDNFTEGLFPSSTETASSRDQMTGLAIGLGVGLPLLLSGIGLLGFYLRRRYSEAGAGEQFKSWLGRNQGDGTAGNGKTGDAADDPYAYSTKAELPADEKSGLEMPPHILEMEGSTADDITPIQPPVASPLLAQNSGADEKRGHGVSGIDKAPIYELPG